MESCFKNLVYNIKTHVCAEFGHESMRQLNHGYHHDILLVSIVESYGSEGIFNEVRPMEKIVHSISALINCMLEQIWRVDACFISFARYRIYVAINMIAHAIYHTKTSSASTLFSF